MIIVLGVVGFIVLVIIIIYNTLIRRKNQVENAFGSIDVYLKKRWDLVPQLVGATKGYMKHEQEVLAQMTSLRTQFQENRNYSNERVGLENQITNSLGKLFVSVEAYPDLKASDNFLMLQRSLNEIEAQVAASRRAFNAAVTDYNNGVETFPNSIVAGMMKYQRRQVFEIPSTDRTSTEATPEIKL
jgi:LemA protein